MESVSWNEKASMRSGETPIYFTISPFLLSEWPPSVVWTIHPAHKSFLGPCVPFSRGTADPRTDILMPVLKSVYHSRKVQSCASSSCLKLLCELQRLFNIVFPGFLITAAQEIVHAMCSLLHLPHPLALHFTKADTVLQPCLEYKSHWERSTHLALLYLQALGHPNPCAQSHPVLPC